MASVFDLPAMAAGYAKSRPSVHPYIIERARKHLPMSLPVERAIDVGCGAGLSTQALQPIARHLRGIDPSATMIQCASALLPGAKFMVGSAESLPLPSQSADLITAAGSLNYTDLTRFFSEAVRVLRAGGALLVYDFSQGRTFKNFNRLDLNTACLGSPRWRRCEMQHAYGRAISARNVVKSKGIIR
jgi:ubiquinone/menaquinone biosynthesis C-methylase UbiE